MEVCVTVFVQAVTAVITISKIRPAKSIFLIIYFSPLTNKFYICGLRLKLFIFFQMKCVVILNSTSLMCSYGNRGCYRQGNGSS